MKKTTLFLTMAASAAILFSACKKDHATVPTTAQRIQTKWTIDKIYSHGVETGYPEYTDTLTGGAGDYIDFRTDNKAYFNLNGDKDTVIYSILSDSQMIIDGDTTAIQVLNDTRFQLYSKSVTSATNYYEYTTYLKK